MYVRRCTPKMFTIFLKLQSFSKFMNFSDLVNIFWNCVQVFWNSATSFFLHRPIFLEIRANFWNSETIFCDEHFWIHQYFCCRHNVLVFNHEHFVNRCTFLRRQIFLEICEKLLKLRNIFLWRTFLNSSILLL